MAELPQSEAGKTWLDEYDKFLESLWMALRADAGVGHPTWLEKPSLGIRSRQDGDSLGSHSSLDDKHEQAKKDREAAEKELLAKVPVEQRDWFAALMRSAQLAGYFSEDHNYYCDLYTGGNGTVDNERDRRPFCREGAIDDPGGHLLPRARRDIQGLDPHGQGEAAKLRGRAKDRNGRDT